MMFEAVKRLLKPRYVYKSAADGRFVSRLYALLHPATTYRMRLQDEGDAL